MEREYSKEVGNVCPYCNSQNTNQIGAGSNADMIWDVMSCSDCNSSWRETIQEGKSFMEMYEAALKSINEEETIKPPIFPAKQIVKIIVEESKSMFDPTCYEETIEMRNVHVAMIEKLSTYEEIDNWLATYRRMSLDEWVESL